MKAIILDDEPKNRSALEKLIPLVSNQVEVVGLAGSNAEALSLIQLHQPDLCFFDVDLGNETCFDLLKSLKDEINFKTIFITAFQQYAIDAFKFNAIDYLLKPIDPDELRAAINKAILAPTNNKQQMANLLQQTEPSNIRKIVLPASDGLSIVEISDIIYLQADSSYTTFYLRGKKKLVVTKTLKEYDDMLSGHGFVRIHNSYLININHLKDYQRGEGGTVKLSDGTHLDVSRRKKEELISAMEKYFLK